MQDQRHGAFAPLSEGASRRSNRLGGLVTGLAVPLASCREEGVLDPQGPIADAQRLLIINATEIMLVVVVPVILATLAFAWWYRSSNARASHSPDWAYQGSIEFVVWSIPTLVVILLGGVCWIGSHKLDPRAPISSNAKPLDVDVVSLDWKWLFIYPDLGIAAVNQLAAPVGTPIHFRLTSATVMNSFFVPQLGSQIYTMAGMTTHLNLMAATPGEFPGFSANFSGDGFAEMRFTVDAMPPNDFDGWVTKAKASAVVLDDEGYAALAKPSIAVPPETFRSVAPKLFERILDLPPRGPESAGGGAAYCSPLKRVGG